MRLLSFTCISRRFTSVIKSKVGGIEQASTEIHLGNDQCLFAFIQLELQHAFLEVYIVVLRFSMLFMWYWFMWFKSKSVCSRHIKLNSFDLLRKNSSGDHYCAKMVEIDKNEPLLENFPEK